MLEWLDCERIVRAVATSTRRARAEAQLAQQGLLGRFALLVGGDEIARGKPAPDIYLEAAARLAIAPADCVALEDSEPGMNAALAAGMMAIMVPDLAPPSRRAPRARRRWCWRRSSRCARISPHCRARQRVR